MRGCRQRIVLLAFLPLALVGCVSDCTFRFATWNIGHFSGGKGSEPTILPAQAEERARAYRAFLRDVGADVLGVCEYSSKLTADGNVSARDTVFHDYDRLVVGPQHWYQWNAMSFRNIAVKESHIVEYPVHEQGVYYLATRIDLGGNDIWLVETHLDWATFLEGHADDRRLQMQKLIDDFKDKPRVIIAGDFNVGRRTEAEDGTRTCVPAPEEYDVFRRAGYELANDSGKATWPSSNPEQPFDNIAVRGLRLLDVRFHSAEGLSDHNAISCRIECE